MIRILLDENLSPAVGRILRADGHDVVHVRDLHAGVVFILDGGLVRDEQLEVLRRVIDRLGHEGDLINQALTVQRDGGFTIEEIPRRV